MQDSQLHQIQKQIINSNYGFSQLPLDKDNLENIQNIINQNKDKYETIVILGIGGSALGPRCLQDIFYNYKVEKPKRFIVLDNIDPDYLTSWSRELNLEKTLFLVISKSGGTPETIAQFWYFHSKITKLQLEIQNHFWFITDPVVGFLRKFASENKITVFDIPQNVGGRFSILSNVGLIFSLFMELDCEKLLAGAASCYNNFCNNNPENLTSFKLANLQSQESKQGKNITVMMPYTHRLKLLGDWYTQLLSESIGKKLNRDNQVVNVGLTPHGAIGVSDQHSQLQLFVEGPKDKIIVFIKVNKFDNKITIPQIPNPEHEYLSGVSFKKLLESEFLATRESLNEAGQSNITLELDEISEFSIGYLLMDLMLSIAILGELYNINCFDQPGVERSKILTKEFLKKS
jgi:glucose-6-phosphate isomerase